MSSFFTLPASQRKRKRADEKTDKPAKRRGVQADTRQKSGPVSKDPRARNTEREESISGSDSEDDVLSEVYATDSEGTSEGEETAADRRVRLAQRYLDNIREEVDETGFDAADIDRDLIAKRLREDVDEAKGRQYRLIASSLDFSAASNCLFRADTQSTTAVAVKPPYAYTVSKDKTLIKWELASPDPATAFAGDSMKQQPPPQKKPKEVGYVRGIKIKASAPQHHGHTASILSLAASPDGKYLATGGADKKLIIWSADSLSPLKTFTSHRDSVTGLSFAPSSSQPGVGSQLFSASMDRTLKTYSLINDDSLAYVETLFGHQDHVLGVAAMAIDECVSVGARDRTARLWKVVDETQLVFRADSSKNDAYATGSVDCVAALPPSHFVTGSESGAISLWSIHRKKPLFTIHVAHGVDQPEPLETASAETDPKVIERLRKADQRRPIPRSITALASVPGTDLVLSGSWDGWIRAWKVSDDKRTLIAQGVVGHVFSGIDSKRITNGHMNGDTTHVGPRGKIGGNVKGAVNSIAVFERRKEIQNEYGGKKDGGCVGLCIVAGTGKETRLGRWQKFAGGKNGAVVFEVPVKAST